MTTATQTQAATRGGILSYLPISLFGSVMGLTGLAVAWRLAQAHFGAPAWIANGVGTIALGAFVALVIAYLAKTMTSFDKVRAELVHPIAGNMFGTLAISLLLIPLLLADKSLALARFVWSIGAAVMVLLAWLMVTRWISLPQKPAHATPVWIVPVVGLLDVPLAVPALGWTNSMHALMVFGTAVGLFFAVPLFTMILSRLMFEEPLPEALQPSLLILAAPFSVGFSAYVATTGAIDGFAVSLYMLMLFVLAILIARMRHLASCCPFRVSWWAVSFPLAASAGAALKYAASVQHPIADAISILLLGLASIVIIMLFVRTIWGIVRGELRNLST